MTGLVPSRSSSSHSSSANHASDPAQMTSAIATGEARASSVAMRPLKRVVRAFTIISTYYTVGARSAWGNYAAYAAYAAYA